MSGKSRDKHKKKNANKHRDTDFDTLQNSLDAFITEEKQSESEIDALLESTERLLQDSPASEQQPVPSVRVEEFTDSPLPSSAKQPLSSFQASGATRHLSVKQNFTMPQLPPDPLEEPNAPEEPFPLTRNPAHNSSKKRNFTIRQDLKPQPRPETVVEPEQEIRTATVTEQEIRAATVRERNPLGPSIVLENDQKNDDGPTIREEEPHQQENETPKQTSNLQPPASSLTQETVPETQKIHVAHVNKTQHAHVLQEEEKRTEITPPPQNQLDDRLIEDEDLENDEENIDDDDDDFEAAVRQARKKLVSAGAMVLVCVVVFFTYQGVAGSGKKGMDSEEVVDSGRLSVGTGEQKRTTLPAPEGNHFAQQQQQPDIGQRTMDTEQWPEESEEQSLTTDHPPLTTLPDVLAAPELGFDELDTTTYDDESGDDPFGDIPSEPVQIVYNNEMTGNDNAPAEILDDEPIPVGQIADLQEPYDVPPAGADPYGAVDLDAFEPTVQPPAFANEEFDAPQIPHENSNFQLPTIGSDPADAQPVVPNHLSLHSSTTPVAPPMTPPAEQSFALPQSQAAPIVSIDIPLDNAGPLPHGRGSDVSRSLPDGRGSETPKLQGKIQGSHISVQQISERRLPLPKRDAAVKSTPAALIASQYDAESPAGQQPAFALPGPKYEDDPPVDTAPDTFSIPLSLNALNTNSVPPQPRQPFEGTESDGFRAQTLADAGTYPGGAQNNERQYLTSPSRPSSQQAPQQLAQQLSPQRQPGSYRSYQVQEGDNLFNIAKRELGSVSRWKEVYQLNRDAIGQDARNLVPGTQIVLP